MQPSEDLKAVECLDLLVSMARNKLKCVGVLVTRIEGDHQNILANSGFKLPEKFQISVPLSHSICQHSVAMDFPLVIDNTITHPLLKGNLAFADLGIVAYLGAPVHLCHGEAIGAICALEPLQRRWSNQEIAIIIQAAEVADRLIAGSAKP